MLHVVAVITAKPGMRSAILEELHPRIPEVLAGGGCLEYITTVDAEVVGPMHTPTKFGPDTFVVIEKWKSVAALADHSGSEMVKDYFNVVEPMIAERVVHILDPAA